MNNNKAESVMHVVDDEMAIRNMALHILDVVTPVGEHGEFFVDRLAPGEHEGRLEFESHTCAFTLQVPTVTAIITDIGVVTCGAEADRP